MKIKVPKFIKILLKPVRIFLKPTVALYNSIMAKVKKNIRAELVLVFIICLLISSIIFGIANSYFRRINKVPHIDYSVGINRLSVVSTEVVNEINTLKLNINDRDRITGILENKARDYDEIKIMLLDLDGKVLYRTSNVSEDKVDIYSLIKNAMELKNRNYQYPGREVDETRKEYISFYPIQLNSDRAYIVVKGIPEGHIAYYSTGDSFIALLISCVAFIIFFMLITKNRMIYLDQIAKGITEISKGNLGYRIRKSGDDELALLAESINDMASELQSQIEAERKAEKTKNELITNVSHDLRTPLTSIMGYLGLIKEHRYKENEEMEEYLNIAYNKSEKLKLLIEDLFEYTKLNNEGIRLYKQPIVINEFLDQLLEELVTIFEENQISVIKEFPNEKVTVDLDVDMSLRVFENLIVNAVKYSHKPSKIRVKIDVIGNDAIVSVQNKGDSIPKEELSKIFDRFYRIEKSRSSTTGGSGLGLAIAKNIVELHGGTIWSECNGDLITFFVKFKCIN